MERQPTPGGAAVHTGTLPSKTLRETALFLSGYRHRDLYRVKVDVDPDLTVAWLLERKDTVRDLETERILGNLERHGVELIHGEGRLADPHTVEVVTAEDSCRSWTARWASDWPRRWRGSGSRFTSRGATSVSNAGPKGSCARSRPARRWWWTRR